MAFGISTRGLSRVANYTAAASLFNSTEKPPRSKRWAENERPLDGARAHHKRMVRHDDRIEFWLYETPLVTYCKDDTIRIKFHYSNSSKAFVHALFGGWMDDASKRVYWCSAKDGEWSGYQFPADEDAVFDKHRNPVNNIQRVRRVVDRSKAARARQKLRDFRIWCKANERMGVQPPFERWAWHDVREALSQPEVNPDIWSVLAWSKDRVLPTLYEMNGCYADVPIDNSNRIKRNSPGMYT